MKHLQDKEMVNDALSSINSSLTCYANYITGNIQPTIKTNTTANQKF